uniref:Uncharacterized protein n=1 Tax=Romanomermis culicivorax TaxID=13658 RepID=A0A915J493_ROMCU
MKGAMKQLTVNFNDSFEYGFIHGFFFATYPIHKLDVKVSAQGKDPMYVGLKLQKQIFLEDLRDFRPAVSYHLRGDEKMIDTQQDFKQNIIKVIAKLGNNSEAGKLLSGYVHNLVSFVGTPTLKFKGKNYMRNYLRGIFMSWPGPSSDYEFKSLFYDMYTTEEHMQIIVNVAQCLIVFNFDDKIPLNAESLKLGKFPDAIKEKCIWIVSIFEIETDCTKDFLDKHITYATNVTRMAFGGFVENAVRYDRLSEVDLVGALLLRLNFSNENSLNKI